MDIERLSANDLMTLASDRGPAPMNIAAVLELERDLGADAVRHVLQARLSRVPRLRQRLHRLPPGLGRPIWVDDPAFDLDRHLASMTLPLPDQDALLKVSAELACTPLDPRQPMWRARWVQGLPGERAALVLVLHHVIVDGLGGLAALAALSDAGADHAHDGADPARPGADPTRPGAGFPSPRPTGRQLAVDAWARRARGLGSGVHRLGAVRQGLTELGVLRSRPELVASTSLTKRPAGPTRSLDVLAVPLAEVRDAAHREGGTVNDIIVTAVVGAIASTLLRRGERPPSDIVVSVPVARSLTTEQGRVGNESGVRPIKVPALDDPHDRLRRVIATTSAGARTPRAASAVPLGAVFRGLARVGLFRVFIEHQRLVHTFVTNMRGPADRLTMGGSRIERIVPIAITPGNVNLTFDALSYAGQLCITVVSDPGVVPEHQQVAADLAEELDCLLRGAQRPAQR